MDWLCHPCRLRCPVHNSGILAYQLRLPVFQSERLEEFMYDKTKYIYVGLDLHKEQHTAVIMDCFNEKLGEITFQNKPSEFFNEFKPSKSVFVLSKNAETEKIIKCPRCRTGDMIVRKNEATNRYFVGCSNYPQCDYTVNDTSIMTKTRYCTQCGGFMVERKGRHGLFFGCTNYPYCRHTEKHPSEPTH